MGFLRFNIGRWKLGYIVMDPAHALINVVDFLDTDEVGKGITRDPLKDIESHHKYQRRGDYIEVSSSMKNIQSKASKQTLCYIRKSFCSFENASRKPGLVMPSHSMVVHNNKWIVQGGLFVNLYETDNNYGRVVLWDDDIIGGPTVLKVENTKQLYDQLEVVQKREKVDKVGKALGKTPQQMDELLSKIGNMFNDHAYMSQMKRLYDWFSQSTDTSSAEVQAKFGCKFDKNYNLLVPANGHGIQNTIFQDSTNLDDINQHVQPTWGEENVGIASFENENQFKDFLLKLRRTNFMIVQGNKYDTIDNLLTFYNDYKMFVRDSNRALYLNDFFIQYKETDKPVDGTNLTIKMVNEMIAMHPEFATQMLVSSLSTCVSGDFGNLTEDQLRVEPNKLPVKNYNDRVMGFLRFKIGSDKMGYVVMDPAHGLTDIIVISDSDIKGKVTLGITRDPMKAIRYWHEYQKRGDYIEVSSSIKYIPSKDSIRTMCYIGKSFCSYEKASRKPSLVMPSHSMVVHNHKWNVQGALFVNLYETNKYDEPFVLWHTDPAGSQTVLMYKSVKQLYEQLELNQKEMVYVVAGALGKTRGEMDKLLVDIGTMIDDRVFMSQMKQLYGWLSQEPTK